MKKIHTEIFEPIDYDSSPSRRKLSPEETKKFLQIMKNWKKNPNRPLGGRISKKKMMKLSKKISPKHAMFLEIDDFNFHDLSPKRHSLSPKRHSLSLKRNIFSEMDDSPIRNKHSPKHYDIFEGITDSPIKKSSPSRSKKSKRTRHSIGASKYKRKSRRNKKMC
jgi:hypothetical protein